MSFHKPAPGSVSFNYADRNPRMFHTVHGDGLAIELDEQGNIKVHRDTPEGRVERTIGEVPRVIRDRLWHMFEMERTRGNQIDCHMAAGYVGGQELSRDIQIPVGAHLSLQEALQQFGTPCGMQLRKRGETIPFHSAIILSCETSVPTEGITIAYHKRGHNEGEILPVSSVLKRYKFDPQEHEILFYALPDNGRSTDKQ